MDRISQIGTINLLENLRARLSVAPEPALTDIFTQGTKLIAAGHHIEEGVEGSLRIAILGSMTTNFIARAVAVACAQEEIFPVIVQAPCGAFRQEILNPDSSLYGFGPQVILIVVGWRDCIVDLPLNSSAETVRAAIVKRIDEFEQLWELLERYTEARVVHHLAAPPPYRLTGVGELSLAASPIRQLATFNQELYRRAAGRILFLDLARLSQERGILAMLKSRGWFAAKVPFETDFLPAYVPAIRGMLRSATEREKKVLVLDLDNTLWGGNDSGGDFRLGPGDAASEAYADFLDYVRQLGARGIVLAVCSKHDPVVAEAGFAHPTSVLRRVDFAAFECSWNSKVAGLRRIAASLKLSLASLVFVADNPAECELVRKELPNVATIHLGDDPADYIRRIEEGYWFEFQYFTADDLARAHTYQSR